MNRTALKGIVAIGVMAAESLGWNWAYWQFDLDFVLYDIDKETWVGPIHEALTGSKGDRHGY